MWYENAIRDPAPEWKTGYSFLSLNLRQGAVYHSMVGAFAAARARLFGDDRASWHFSVLKDGTIYQHYPIDRVAWHAGTVDANGKYIGIEHEGGAAPNYSEPLTPAQYRSTLGLTLWLMKACSWPEFRVGVQGMEHNWLYPTACPSGRIPWSDLIRDISKEGTVDQELRDRIRAASAFEAVALAVKQQYPVQSLPKETLDTVKFILKVAGVI